jgi:small-conductance mechanosensitive channel
LALSQQGVRLGQPVTVIVWNRPIVELRAGFDDIGPNDRAARIERRIKQLPDEALLGTVVAKPAQIGGLKGWLISVDDTVVLGLLPEDVDPESGKTVEQVAKQAVSRLESVLRAMAQQQRLPTLLRGVGFALLATVLFSLVLWAIIRLRRHALEQFIERVEHRPKLAFGIDMTPIFAGIQRSAIKLTAFAAAVIVLYLWLAFVLVQFPYSRPWGVTLREDLIGELGRLGAAALGEMPGLFTVLVIFLVTRIIARAIGNLLRSIEEGAISVGWLEPETVKPTHRVIIGLIWIFALTLAYPYIPGSDTVAFKGISVLLGIMISIGSAGLINQVMSGLAIIYSRTFRVGDYVRASEHEGTVSHIGVLSCKITNRKREEITIPNAVLIGQTVTNYSRLSPNVVATTAVTIGYDVPWRQVHALLMLAAERTPGICQEPRPFVLQPALADFYVEYQLIVYIERIEERVFVLSDLHAHIQDLFNEFGVQIMSPHFVSQPEGAIVVPKSKWHTPPATEKEGAG